MDDYDKQKIKEAINKVLSAEKYSLQDSLKIELFKELNLDGE